MNDEFISQAELGRLLFVSEHRLIRLLVYVGLRNRDMMPSERAYNEGLVKDREGLPPGRHFWLWHKEKTIKAIENAFQEKDDK